MTTTQAAAAERINWTEGFRVNVGPYTLGLAESSPETEGYWDGVEQDELRLKRCADCGQFLHPRRIVCSACMSLELGWQRVTGEGEVYTFSQVFRAPRPELVRSAPYYVGIVRLKEGVHLFSRLLPEDGGDVVIGAPVTVDFRVLEGGQKLPVFRVAAHR